MPAMAARWSADSVLALAPDDASRRAAATLARPAPWDGAGAAGDLVWGQCAGSGKSPYQVIVDLAGPAFKCSCPSRKFPCKHALAVLLLWSAGTVPDEREPADYARAWQEARQAKAEGPRAAARTEAGDSPRAAGSPASASGGAGPGPDDSGSPRAEGGAPAPGLRREGARDERTSDEGGGRGPERPEASGGNTASAAKRAAERAQRVTDGLTDLREWLRDQVRAGLAGGGTSQAELMAARMVDAQAPGVAAALRGLAGAATASPRGGPGGLLAEYALLHLLIRAHERLGQLPAGLAAVVRSRVGYPVSKHDVLARPAVTDHWLVLAVRELTDGTVPGRRIWVRGRRTGQWAMLLTFAAPNGAWQDLGTARLRPGTEVHADLHYYPGQPPLRALIGTRHADPAPGAPPGADDAIDAQLTDWSAALEQDPWLTTWPVLLAGTPVPSVSALDGAPAAHGSGLAGDAPPAGQGSRWHLVDRAGRALPLADRESLWTLLAVSGGDPVTVAGEWHPDGLVALTTWHGDQAVML